MALPVLVLGALFRSLAGRVILMARSKGVLSLVGAGALYSAEKLASSEMQEFRRAVYEFGAAQALDLAGIELDSDDPFSDRSLCDALGKKTGISLRTLRDRESIREDAERWALAMLERETGLHIRDIRDGAGVVKDLMRFASPVVADATGLPLSDISDVEATKADVGSYLKDRALVLLSHDVERARVLVGEALVAAGATLEGLVAEISAKAGVDPATGEPRLKIDAQMIALGILARALVAADKRRRDEAAAREKLSRRQVLARANLKRFRDRHGHRMRYERIGEVAP